jgi:hypothetical protein
MFAFTLLVQKRVSEAQKRVDNARLFDSDEDGSCVCDQYPGNDEHIKNEVHALLFCQDHRVCELRKQFSFLFTPFLRTFQQPNPFCFNKSTTNLFMNSFPQQSTRFFFFPELMDLFVAGQDRSAADQPNNLAEGHPLL